MIKDNIKKLLEKTDYYIEEKEDKRYYYFKVYETEEDPSKYVTILVNEEYENVIVEDSNKRGKSTSLGNLLSEIKRKMI